MPIRRILVDLELAALADPGASGDVLLVITPDGVLKRQEIPPPMSTLTYGPGTYDLVVPPGVTSLQVEAQAPGGGAAGAGTTGTPGTPGTDGGNTEVLRAGIPLVRAFGGKGGRYNAPVGSRAGRGGFGGLGGISYRGGDGLTVTPWSGGAAGVSIVDTLRGQGGLITAEASSGGGGAGANNTVSLPGGGGEYVAGQIPVTPGETLTLVVGTGGPGGAGSTAAQQPGRSGGPGFLVLRW